MKCISKQAWWLIAMSVIYGVSALIAEVFEPFPHATGWAQWMYTVLLSLPFLIRPLGRWVGVKPLFSK